MPPLHPSPTIQANLCLVVQPLTNSVVGRTAEITFALANGTGATAQGMANAFQTAFNAQFTSAFATQVTIEKPFVRLGDGTSVPTEAVASGATAIGTRAMVSLPPQVALLARKRTVLGGRKNRGRSYFPWVLNQADITDNGSIVAGTIAAFETRTDAFLGALHTAAFDMVIPHKTLATDPDTKKKYVTAITLGPTVSSYVVESIVATQRRRLPR